MENGRRTASETAHHKEYGEGTVGSPPPGSPTGSPTESPTGSPTESPTESPTGSPLHVSPTFRSRFVSCHISSGGLSGVSDRYIRRTTNALSYPCRRSISSPFGFQYLVRSSGDEKESDKMLPDVATDP